MNTIKSYIALALLISNISISCGKHKHKSAKDKIPTNDEYNTARSSPHPISIDINESSIDTITDSRIKYYYLNSLTDDRLFQKYKSKIDESFQIIKSNPNRPRLNRLEKLMSTYTEAYSHRLNDKVRAIWIRKDDRLILVSVINHNYYRCKWLLSKHWRNIRDEDITLLSQNNNLVYQVEDREPTMYYELENSVFIPTPAQNAFLSIHPKINLLLGSAGSGKTITSIVKSLPK